MEAVIGDTIDTVTALRGSSIAAVAALDDETRRALYRCVREARRPVSREEAARAVGISRKLAAFHLDKLVAAGLLSSTCEPVSGVRRVGRAPKLYRPSPTQVTVSIPAREPALLAGILIDAVLETGPGERADEVAMRAARARGEELGASERARSRPGRLGAERGLRMCAAVAERYGYEPETESSEPGEPAAVRMCNCPFYPLAQKAPELVCGMNREFFAGILAGLQSTGVEVVLRPRDGECCIELRSAAR